MQETRSDVPPGNERIELWPLLVVRDIERSISFYCDRLGFELAQKAEAAGKVFWCRLSRQDCSLMLQQANPKGQPVGDRGRGVILYFVCEDADRIHRELTGRGLALAPPQTAYYGMRQVELTDPDGYNLCFESQAPQ